MTKVIQCSRIRFHQYTTIQQFQLKHFVDISKKSNQVQSQFLKRVCNWHGHEKTIESSKTIQYRQKKDRSLNRETKWSVIWYRAQLQTSNSGKFGLLRTVPPNSGGHVIAAILLWDSKLSAQAVMPPELLTSVIILEGVATISVDLVDILKKQKHFINFFSIFKGTRAISVGEIKTKILRRIK